MKRLVFALLPWLTLPLCAAAPNPANYTLTMHVVCSFVRGQVSSHPDTQWLGVALNGKQLELMVINNGSPLAPGDYKARLLKDTSPNTYDIRQTYELLLPDGKVRTYQVTGMGPGACSSRQ